QLERLQHESSQLRAGREELQAELQSLSGRMETTADQLAAEQASRNELMMQLEHAQREAEQLRTDRGNLQAEVALKEQLVARLNQEFDDVSRDFHRVSEKY